MLKAVQMLVAAAVGLSLAAVVGCGSGEKMNPVSGTVKFADGSPLTTGQIVFSSGTASATGAIGSDGTYSLTSIEPGDGAPAGTYKVTIVATEGGGDAYEAEQAGGTATPEKSLVDKKYGSTSTTDLQFEVKPGKNTIDITVDKPGGAGAASSS